MYCFCITIFLRRFRKSTEGAMKKDDWLYVHMRCNHEYLMDPLLFWEIVKL
uniref:Uncharacterized protein n=1 Tax=Nelumbo nucifera TaxID=4432 RepID=A0A822Z6G8_NELNU|nr:TPA_asm: hypothetical protein HUJ06_012889 [Nelumbo nucifera]